MNDEVRALQDECDQYFRRAQEFCFITPASELQQEQIDNLNSLATYAGSIKEKAIKAKDEDSANALLSLEETVAAFISELQMWITLKDYTLDEDAADRAWNSLMDAQQHTRRAMQAHRIAEGLSAVSSRLLLLEKALFPSQVFVSAGMIIEEAKCSICHEKFGTCDHLKGLPYMGELCARIITKVEFLEASYVSKPADKKCRILQASSDGTVYTHRLTKRNTSIPRTPSAQDNEDTFE